MGDKTDTAAEAHTTTLTLHPGLVEELGGILEQLRRLLEGGAQPQPAEPPPAPTTPPVAAAAAPWLTYALGLVGEREVPGQRSNPRILAIIKEFLPAAQDDSSVAWCGAFAAHCLRRYGMTYPQEMPLLARAYLDSGQVVRDAQPGDVVVFWRGSGPNDWRGHVAFYLGGQGTGRIEVVGGNQTDAVTRTYYPESRVLGFRRPQVDTTAQV